jgi:hypothetical protein
MPAFQPYWGKPAVRNDREDRGNVGIMRSPIRASIPPDHLRHPQTTRRPSWKWNFSEVRTFDGQGQESRIGCLAKSAP